MLVFLKNAEKNASTIERGLFIRQQIFIYYKYKSFLNTFKYGTQLA